MAIFSISAVNANYGELGRAVESKFADNFYKINERMWLVSTSKTAEQISKDLQISEGRMIGGVVLQVGSYYGRSSVNLWDWMKANWGGSPNG